MSRPRAGRVADGRGASTPASGTEAVGPSRTQLVLGRANVAATRTGPVGAPRRTVLPAQPLVRHLIFRGRGSRQAISVITSRVSSYDNFQNRANRCIPS